MMRNWLWYKIWKNGRLVCPDCYCRLNNDDREQREDYSIWFCRACDDHIENMDTGYSWYWPFDILWPRLRYLAGNPRRRYRGWQGDR